MPPIAHDLNVARSLLTTVLELPYVLRSAGRSTVADWLPPVLREALQWQHEPATRNRRALKARAGRVSIPFLADPNTGVEMSDSASIVDYLNATYAR